MKDTWYIYVRAPHAETLRLKQSIMFDTEGPNQRHIPVGHPLACVAVRVVGARENEPNLVELRYGVSIWNPLDAFNRLTARNKALGRSKLANAPAMLLPKELPYRGANQRILNHVFDGRQYAVGFGETERIPARVLNALATNLKAMEMQAHG